MSKKRKPGRAVGGGRSARANMRSRRAQLLVIVPLALCVLAAGAASLRWGKVRHAVGLAPLTGPQATPTPLTLAKEYIYAGGRLVATEEPPPLPTGPAPSNLVATASATTSVRLQWQAPAGQVTKYEVERRQAGGGFARVAEVPAGPATVIYDDNGRSPSAAYLYQVRAVFSGGGLSSYSNQDIATTVLFEDDPLAAGVPVRFRHVEQLRTAVEAVWALAGQPGAPDWSGSPSAQQLGPIYAWHFKRLREQLDPALASLGLPQVGADATLAVGQRVKKEHIQDVRNRVK